VLTLKYFARLREQLGPQESIAFVPGQSLENLRDALIARGGAHAEALDRAQFLRCALNQQMADDLFEVVTSGKVKIRIDQRYPLADVAQAHRDLEARKTTGCTILTV
jgi:NADPH:quinone reductase-like Zn-dependent oxidoreductase